MIARFVGSGPGEQAPDGCSVELYRRLPYLGELTDVRPHLVAGTALLELGCGTGRLTALLLAWGLRVTCVDNCDGMLALAPTEARHVLSDIEDLSLREHFDVALLASCLINHPTPQVRRALLAGARRHLRTDGRLFVQRQDPQWLQSAVPGPVGQTGEVLLFLESVARIEQVVEMTLRYESSGQTWRHSFSASPLTESDVEEALATEGFHSPSWLGRHGSWVMAVAG